MKQPAGDGRLVVELAHDLVAYPLEDAGHGDHGRRPECHQVLGQFGDGPAVGDARAADHGQVVADGALEGMGQRQKGQEQVVGVDMYVLLARPGVPEDVVMAQHHALGTARGAGGIDDGGEFVGFAVVLAQPTVAFLAGPVVVGQGRGFTFGIDGADADDAVQKAQLVAHRFQPFPVLAVADEQYPGTRVLQDVGNVLGPVVGVEGHHHQAQAERGLIDGHPFLGIAEQDGDAVAPGEVLFGQGVLAASHGLRHVGPGAVPPGPGFAVVLPVGEGLRAAPDPFAKEAGQGAGGFGGNDVTCPLLRHCSDSPASPIPDRE